MPHPWGETGEQLLDVAWLETESPCDPLNPAYVSADTQEPLNYIPVYHNFLEYVMPTVLENPEAFSLTPAGRPQAIGPPQDDQERRRRTLASVASARLSAAAADSYWDTWPDVESNAGELLREYVSAPKALMEDLADNPIVAMTLLAHASLIASRNHPPYPAPATDREDRRSTHRLHLLPEFPGFLRDRPAYRFR